MQSFISRFSSSVAAILAASLVAVGVAGLVAVASASIPSSDGTIEACYQKNNGNLRVVDEGQFCRNSEKPISWNQQGPKGEPGGQGSPGDLSSLEGMTCQRGSEEGTVAVSVDAETGVITMTCEVEVIDPCLETGTNCDTDVANCGGLGNDVTDLDNVAEAGCMDGVPTIESCDFGWANADGDPYNGCELDIDADGDGFIDQLFGGDDCNDSDSAINPAALEIQDAKDNDCDGIIDEGLAVTSVSLSPSTAGVGEVIDVTVQLSDQVLQDTAVLLDYPEEVLGGPGSVIIPAGSSTATAQLTILQSSEPVTITASFNGTSSAAVLTIE